MSLLEIDWPWDDPLYRPPPMESSAKARLRMQQSFHAAMTYRGKKTAENEEREAIMEHYDILGPEMRWDFVKSYHTADSKAEWRRFVIEYGAIPEDILHRSEFREDLERLRATKESYRMALEDEAVQKPRREAAEAIEKEREAEQQRQKQLAEEEVHRVLKREWSQMAKEDDLAWEIRENENDAIKKARTKARISARAKAHRDEINAQRQANREELRRRRAW